MTGEELDLGWEDARDVDLEAQLRTHRSRRRRELAERARRRRDAVLGVIVGGGLAAVCAYLGAGGSAWPTP